jgi:hypothetical protein
MAIIRTSKEVPCDKKGYRIWNVKLKKRDFNNLTEERELVIADKDRSKAIKQINNEFGKDNIVEIRQTVRMVDLSI